MIPVYYTCIYLSSLYVCIFLSATYQKGQCTYNNFIMSAPSHHFVCHMCYLPCVMIMVGSLESDRHMGKSLVWHLHGWLFLGRHDWTSDHLQESVNVRPATWLPSSLSWWDTNFWELLVGASPRSPPSTGQNSWKLHLWSSLHSLQAAWMLGWLESRSPTSTCYCSFITLGRGLAKPCAFWGLVKCMSFSSSSKSECFSLKEMAVPYTPRLYNSGLHEIENNSSTCLRSLRVSASCFLIIS